MSLNIHVPDGSNDNIEFENFTCVCNMCGASAKIGLLLHYPSWNVVGAKITCDNCDHKEEQNYS